MPINLTLQKWSDVKTKGDSTSVEVKVYTNTLNAHTGRVQYEQIVSTLRTVADAVASKMVMTNIKDTNVWTDNASAVAANKAEYTRVNTCLAEHFASGQYVLLERQRGNGSKRIRITQISDDAELQGGNDNYYEVCAGDLYGTEKFGQVVDRIQGTQKDISSIVSREMPQLNAHTMSSLKPDPYRRQMQFKYHLSSIGQAFIHAGSGSASTDLFSENHLQDWMGSRHTRSVNALLCEFADTCSLVARAIALPALHDWFVCVGTSTQWRPMFKNTITLGSSDFQIKRTGDDFNLIVNTTTIDTAATPIKNPVCTFCNCIEAIDSGKKTFVKDGGGHTYKLIVTTAHDAWFSKHVYEPVIQTLGSQTDSVASICDNVTDYTNMMLHSYTECKFETNTRNHALTSENKTILEGVLHLTPVPPDQMGTASKPLTDVEFGTRLTLSSETGAKQCMWFIGLSPTPSLDAMEAAVALLQCKLIATA